MLRFWKSPFSVLLLLVSMAAGQTHENVLYSFGTNPNDGNTPNGDLTFDDAGNIYGTTAGGHDGSNGTVFELSFSGGAWKQTTLYSFCSLSNCTDGVDPQSGVVFDAQGNLYGTTKEGGRNSDGGVVYELSPPPQQGGTWTETILWAFSSGNDGEGPTGHLTWDAAGNLYGTTAGGGAFKSGSVFELSPGSGGWTLTTLYSFCPGGPPCPDGELPYSGVTFDSAGNLYGTTNVGGSGNGVWGVLYQLSPVGGSWSQRVLADLSSRTAGNPTTAVVIDPAGSLYGALPQGGADSHAQCGSVFRLTPLGGGSWQPDLFPFDGSGVDGCVLKGNVSLDLPHKTLYSTAAEGGSQGSGTVFKISHNQATVLYVFCKDAPQCSDGSYPVGSILHDGKLYGVTALGGTSTACGQSGCGTVFELTP